MSIRTITDTEGAEMLAPWIDCADLEAAHSEADGVLRHVLVSLGYGRTVAAWDAVGKWYA